jgi:hypothetical protein
LGALCNPSETTFIPTASISSLLAVIPSPE